MRNMSHDKIFRTCSGYGLNWFSCYSRIIIDNKRESQGSRNSRNELKQHLKQGFFRTKCNKLNDSPNPSTMCHLLPIVVILFVKIKWWRVVIFFFLFMLCRMDDTNFQNCLHRHVAFFLIFLFLQSLWEFEIGLKEFIRCTPYQTPLPPRLGRLVDHLILAIHFWLLGSVLLIWSTVDIRPRVRATSGVPDGGISSCPHRWCVMKLFCAAAGSMLWIPRLCVIGSFSWMWPGIHWSNSWHRLFVDN